MKSSISRLQLLLGFGSVAALAACGGPKGSPMLPGASNTPLDASKYFRVVKSRASALRHAKGYAYNTPIPAGTVAYRDPVTYTTTVTDSSGNGSLYGANGGLLLNVETSPLSDGSGITVSATLNDGSQYSTIIPPLAMFAPDGTTTIGAMTMNANQPGGVYTATVQTANGVASLSAQPASGGGYLLTFADGSTAVLPQAVLDACGLASANTVSAMALRHTEVSAGCIAAIGLLIAAILGLIAIFWYAAPIIGSLAASIAVELNAAAAAGTIAATSAGVAAQATTVWATLAAALTAVFAGSIALINVQCASTPTPAPTPTNAPTNTPTNAPTAGPTNVPTAVPTNAPTTGPTGAPTNAPTTRPTSSPTNAPTQLPTVRPTTAPQ